MRFCWLFKTKQLMIHRREEWQKHQLVILFLWKVVVTRYTVYCRVQGITMYCKVLRFTGIYWGEVGTVGYWGVQGVFWGYCRYCGVLQSVTVTITSHKKIWELFIGVLALPPMNHQLFIVLHLFLQNLSYFLKSFTSVCLRISTRYKAIIINNNFDLNS